MNLFVAVVLIEGNWSVRVFPSLMEAQVATRRYLFQSFEGDWRADFDDESDINQMTAAILEHEQGVQLEWSISPVKMGVYFS